MELRWRNEWLDAWPRLVSPPGFEIRRQGQQFDLYREAATGPEWVGRYPTAAAAKDDADLMLCNARRAELGTGSAEHRLVDGRGGSWDVDVALRLASGREPERVGRLREISDTGPAGPVVCVSLEIIRQGEYVAVPYVLVGVDRARELAAAGEGFLAVVLPFDASEVVRVPDLTDTPEAREVTRLLRRTHPRFVPGRVARRCPRPAGDLVQRVREHLGLGRGRPG